MRYTLGFLTGAAVGAAVALLTTPNDGEANREWLRHKTDELAAGDSMIAGVIGGVRGFFTEQQARLNAALEAGQREAARHEAALWQQLKLPPPDKVPVPGATTGAEKLHPSLPPTSPEVERLINEL